MDNEHYLATCSCPDYTYRSHTRIDQSGLYSRWIKAQEYSTDFDTVGLGQPVGLWRSGQLVKHEVILSLGVNDPGALDGEQSEFVCAHCLAVLRDALTARGYDVIGFGLASTEIQPGLTRLDVCGWLHAAVKKPPESEVFEWM